ncbi:hypothetical protein V9K67_09110 [Paraflavisolibacter sp. H34]|uniref:hypothetical protein n=1 Tax=Huijunlia imazamoxiresistens TaxID=3127457 RepID=UPI0030178897
MNSVQGKVIGISISKSSDLASLGFADAHLENAQVEIARYLLYQGYKLAYGGDLRKEGFTRQLFMLVDNYVPLEKEKEVVLHSYLGYPIGADLTKEEKANLKKAVHFEVLPLPPDLPAMPPQQMKEDKTPESRYYWFRSMSNMREKMNKAIDARIVLGGQSKGFKSKYPGIVEEVFLAMQTAKPTYLCGAFGGATQSIIEAITKKTSPRLSMNYFTDSLYKESVALYNQKRPDEPVDYQAITTFFSNKGIEGLKNGLTEEENKLLFSTIHIPQMISLILKGLRISLKIS